jgi:hypothetical protein
MIKQTNITKSSILTIFLGVILLSMLILVPGKAYAAVCANGDITPRIDLNLPEFEKREIDEIYCNSEGRGGFAGSASNDSAIVGGSAPNTEQCVSTPESPLQANDDCLILKYTVAGINFLSALAGIALIASLMIAGFQYMTAQDDPSKVQKSKARIIQTLLALLLFIFMYSLLNFLVPGGVLPG